MHYNQQTLARFADRNKSINYIMDEVTNNCTFKTYIEKLTKCDRRIVCARVFDNFLKFPHGSSIYFQHVSCIGTFCRGCTWCSGCSGDVQVAFLDIVAPGNGFQW